MLAIVDKVIGRCAVAACALLTTSTIAWAQPASTPAQPPAPAQDQAPAAQPQDQASDRAKDQERIHEQTPLGQEQLDQILAPIALYPDNLLAQVLTASTYPLEVVMAARWIKEHPDVKGDALDQAMLKQPWDPSVKGLTAVPQVLAMMSDKLDWMEQLGEAYLAQPDDVTKTVQKLRARAEATGTLKSSKEIKVKKVKAPPPPPPRPGAPAPTVVVTEPEYIEIESAVPDVIYVPVYDPVVVYGAWPYPLYRPFYWRPPGYVYAGVFGFGAAFVVGPALWCHYDWYRRGVWIDVRRYNRFNHTHLVAHGGDRLRWRHDPRHRGIVPYRNTNLRQQYSKGTAGHGVSAKPTGVPKGVGAVQTKPRMGVAPTKPKTQVKPKKVTPHTATKPVHKPKAPTKPTHTRKPLAKSSSYNRARPVNTARPVRSSAAMMPRSRPMGRPVGRPVAHRNGPRPQGNGGRGRY